MDKSPNISLILESFQHLEKAYMDLRKNISMPKEEFVNNKLLLDKVRISFNLAFESSMRPCRHLSMVYQLKTTSRDCLIKLGEHIGMDQLRALRELTEFYLRYRDLKDEVSPEELYDFLSENLVVFRHYAQSVIEYIKRTTNNRLLIDFDLLNRKAKHVKDSVKKVSFILLQGFDEFKKKPMYYDRVKYFYQVAYDSLFDICKHLAPKFGIKKFGDDCLSKFVEIGVLPQEYYVDVLKMTNLKNKLISTWEVSPEELYRVLVDVNEKFEPILKEVSKSLRGLIEGKG
ncbi:MAG: HepT-like ribonuclease domain-containing protein [Aquificaceae bacterium]